MSIIHRRVLPASESRCTPLPDCPLQNHCARFTSPLLQGHHATMANFMVDMKDNKCPHYLPEMQTDADAAKTKDKPATKPPIGSILFLPH